MVSTGISPGHQIPHTPIADLPVVYPSMVAGGGPELYVLGETEGGGS